MKNCRIFDAHCDTAFELWHRGAHLAHNDCHIALDKARDFSAYAQIFAFCSLAGWDGLPIRTQELLSLPLAYLRREVEEHAAHVGFAVHTADIEALHAAGKMAALLSIEGPEVIDCNPDRLKSLRCQGFVMTTLTWNADNALAGWHGSGNGLTPAGRDFVREAERCGILIDVSHLSERAFWELAECSTGPILASHSNARSVWEHSRNLTDDQLRTIGQSGGVVGLNLYTDFLGQMPTLDTLCRHLDRMLTCCGETHVCLGGDLDGCETLPDGFHDLHDYISLREALLRNGFDDALLDRICYSNLLELLKREER